MKLTYEGHACFTLTTKDAVLLIDPYLSDNPLSAHKPEELHPDAVLVTHAHHDHLGDAVSIARSCGAVLAGTVELLGALPDTAGLQKVAFQPGGTAVIRGVQVMMTPAWHGSGSIQTEKGPVSAGLAVGYIISDGDKTVYHAGDTALFGDMGTVLSRYNLDCALLPIGDFFTMGPADAATAAQWLKAPVVIPMHYNTFPSIRQDPAAFAKLVQTKSNSTCVVLNPGESYTL